MEAKSIEELEEIIKKEIDSSEFLKIKLEKNGDRFFCDLNRGYMADSSGKIKCWYVKDGMFGGKSVFVEAYVGWNGVFGPGAGKGLYPKPPEVFR